MENKKENRNNSSRESFNRDIVCRLGSMPKPYGDYNLEVNIIKWNKGRAKLDIRSWNKNGVQPTKGVTFTREEYYWLISTLCRVNPLMIEKTLRNNAETEEEKQEAENLQKHLAEYSAHVVPPEQNRGDFYLFDSEEAETEENIETENNENEAIENNTDNIQANEEITENISEAV